MIFEPCPAIVRIVGYSGEAWASLAGPTSFGAAWLKLQRLPQNHASVCCMDLEKNLSFGFCFDGKVPAISLGDARLKTLAQRYNVSTAQVQH